MTKFRKVGCRQAVGAMIGWCLGVGSAMAQIYEYQWTDHVTGTVTSAKPEREWYAVKSGTELVVTVIAGLDRKAKLEVSNGGTQVFSSTSPTININNRITASDGLEFYGVKFNVPISGEGTYQIVSRITDPSGQEASTNSYKLKVDTTPPSMTGTLVWRQAGYAGGSIEVFGGIAGQQIELGGITDTQSGIKTVRWFTIDENGKRRTHAKNPVKYSGDTGLAYVLMPDAVSVEVAPTNRSDYTVGFEAEDKAGNKAELSRVSGIDRSPAPTSMQVKNAKTGVWENYTPGMLIYANPIDFRAGVPAKEYTPLTGGKFGALAISGSYQEGDWVWKQASFPIPQSYSYWEFYTTAGGVSHIPIKGLKFTYADGVDEAPAYKTMRAEVDGNQWTDGPTVMVTKPAIITKLQATVAPRTYTQKVTFDSANSPINCLVPPGEETCTMNLSHSLPAPVDTIHYSPRQIHVMKSDGTMLVHGGYLYTYWDTYKPVVKKKEVLADGTANTLIHEKRVNNWQIGTWTIKKIAHLAKNKATGVEAELPVASMKQPSYDEWDFTTNTKSLADGVYDISVYAEDRFGNVTKEDLAMHYIVDNTPPSISFASLNGPLGNKVAALTDIIINLADAVDGSPKVTRATLSGGVMQESLEVGIAKVGGGWRLQPPRMFPSLDVGQEYILTIRAVDESKNIAEKKFTFSLVPENLVSNGVLDVLAISKQLYDVSDKPLHVVKLKDVRNKNGALIKGQHVASVSIRKDADFGVVVNGLPVAPGETKEMVINFLSGSAEVEMWPETPGKSGVANYMLYLPQLMVE